MKRSRLVRWRRRAVAVALAVATLLVLAIGILSLPPVQRALWKRVVAAHTADSDWSINAGEVQLSLFSGSLEIVDFEIVRAGSTVASADSIDASWGWLELMRSPHRIERMAVEGGVVDLRHLPPPEPDQPQAGGGLPLDGIEIGDLEFSIRKILWSVEAVDLVAAEKVSVSGSLVDGRAGGKAEAAVIRAVRGGRSLGLDATQLEWTLDSQSVRLEISGGGRSPVSLVGSAEVEFGEDRRVDSDLVLGLELEETANWWSPELAQRVDPRGELRLEGGLGWSERGGFEAMLRHRGSPVFVAGYPISELRLEAVNRRSRFRVSDPRWGFVEVGVKPDRRMVVRASFDDAPTGPAAHRLQPEIARWAPRNVTISGTADLVLPAPPETLDPELLEGKADLEARWPGGELSLEAETTDGGFQVREFVLGIADNRLDARGRVAPDGRVSAVVDIDVPHPARVVGDLAPWLPGRVEGMAPGGGPLTAHAEIDGRLDRPEVDVRLSWQEPSWGGISGGLVALTAHGTADDLRWQLGVTAASEVRLHAAGRAELDRMRFTGSWRLEGARPAPSNAADSLSIGDLSASGRFEWRGGLRSANATVRADQLSIGKWELDGLVADGRIRDSRLEIRRFELTGLGALLAGTLSVPLTDGGPVAADFRLDGLDPRALPIGLPEFTGGRLRARLRIEGSTDQTTSDLVVDWQPSAGDRPPPLQITGGVSSGRLFLQVPTFELAGGDLEARATVPLGNLPSPDWLWPRAQAGPLKVEVTGERLQLQPLLELVGIAAPPITVSSGLRLEALWNVWDAGPRRAELSLPGLTVSSTRETLRAREPLRVLYRDGELVVPSFELEGDVSRARGRGRFAIDGGAGWAETEVVAGPSWIRLIPFDLDATGSVAIRMGLEGLPSGPTARFEIEQLDGELIAHDPPVRITEMGLEVGLAEGVWSVTDGSAAVNSGQVLIGGEWNVGTGQGVIFGLEDIAFLLPEGILTRWDGAVVVEPAAERAARVIGELMMTGGVWDEPVDLQAVLFGDDLDVGTPSELMYETLVDIEVYGRGALEVENNLGDFEVTWQAIDIGGTLAEPLVRGDLTLVPGGVITLTGDAVEIARGTISFTGVPGAAPEVEIIPARDAFASGNGIGAGFDADLLLRRGIASSLLGSVLGLRNETLAPATVAVETLTDPSTNSLISRRIGRHVALFLAADLSNVQNRTMLLQLDNWRQIPGLAVQGINDSRSGTGAAVIERFSWGGSVTPKPRIRRVRLEGDWPVRKRRLKRAVQLERGWLYDPFLVFVGRSRLERELAREGYYRARVEASVSEESRSPVLTFTVDPGPHQEVVFRGGDLPEPVRRDIVARYRPPPSRSRGFREMRRTAREYLDAVHHPEATVEVFQDGDLATVRIERGSKIVYDGPRVPGVDTDAERTLRRLLGSASELAVLARERPEAIHLAERVLGLEGYRDPEVRRVDLEKQNQDHVQVRLEVEHGGRAVVKDVSVSGRDPLQAVGLDDLPIRSGTPASSSVLAAVEREIRDTYRASGYTDVEVEGRIVGEGKLRDVVIDLDPGRQYRVSEIRISGLRYLKESLLRRGIDFEEDDLVQPGSINQSIVQLAAFAPVARVDVETVDAGPDEVDFDFRITERPRWTVGAGARWSTETGILGLFDLRDDGLFGRGFSLNMRGLIGSRRKSVGLIASLPRAPGGRWSSALTLSYRDVPSTTEPDRAQEVGRSASLEATVQLRESLAMRGYYLLDDQVSSSLVVDQLPSGEPRVRQSTLGWQGILDRLDDPLDPRHGYYLALDVGWSSPAFGGDVDALRTLLTASWASAPRTSWTWARTLRLGWAESLNDRPLTEQVRFFAGGESSIRGFERDLVGPVVERPDGSLRPLGGGALVVLNEEIRVPVWTHDNFGIFRIAAFADIGQVWAGWSRAGFDLAVGAGFGLRWDSPVGPIWADIAWPVAGVQGDDRAKFSIGIGRPF